VTFFGKQLSEAEKKRRTMHSLASVFARTTRILTGRSVSTKVVNDLTSPFPAWTIQDPEQKKADCIHFNLAEIGEVRTAQDIVRVTGVSHHETAHVWFTPPIPMSSRNPIGAALIDLGSNGTNAFNILEDQRIESDMVAMYSSIRHYYSAAIAGYILNGTEDDLSTAWLLVHGRRYLGSELRDGLRQVFVSQEHTDEIARIIDDYRVLDLYQQGHQLIAARLIRQLTKIMYDDMPQQPSYSHSCTYSYAPATAEDKASADRASGKVRSGKDDRDKMKKDEDDEEAGNGSKPKDADEGEEEADENNGAGDDGSDAEEDEEGDAGSGSDSDLDDEDDGDGEDADSDGGDEAGRNGGSDDDGDASDGTPQAGGSRAGDGTEPVDRSAIEQIADAIADLLNDVMSDEQVAADIKRAQDAIRNQEHEDTIGAHRGWVSDTRADVVNTARVFGRKLAKVRNDLDPGWEYRQPQGRLNVQRAMHSDPLGDVWDSWDHGKTDTTDIEVVLAVDVSGSMGAHTESLSNGTWAIKHACDSIQVLCTVYAYDHKGYLVYKARDRAQPGQFPNMPAVGGTQPKRVLVECARVLAASRRSKKLFVVMTDGIWGGSYWYGRGSDPDDISDAPEHDDIIAEMNGANVLTAMVYLTGARDAQYMEEHIDWHNTQVHAVMPDLSGFPAFADQLVRRLMKK
jgi:hypothetical protein